MLINFNLNVGFLHIPKSAGISIRMELQKHGEWVRNVKDFHVWGTGARSILTPPIFNRLRWFAVVRHPVDAIVASYKRTRDRARQMDLSTIADLDYRDYLRRAIKYKNLGEYARDNWIADNDYSIKRGGFYYSYCTDNGDPLPVRVLRFENLKAGWKALCEDWQLPYGPLPHANKSEGEEDVPPQLRRDILDYCFMDCEKYGYK